MELHLGETWAKDLLDPSVLRGPSAHSEHNGQGNSLGVQWLGLSTATAGAMGLIPGGGAKSLQAVCAAKKQKNPMARASGSPETLMSLNSRPAPLSRSLPLSSPLFSHPLLLPFHLIFLPWRISLMIIFPSRKSALTIPLPNAHDIPFESCSKLLDF